MFLRALRPSNLSHLFCASLCPATARRSINYAMPLWEFSVDGTPYYLDTKDQARLEAWLTSRDSNSTGAAPGVGGGGK
jgi:hypothetical protein